MKKIHASNTGNHQGLIIDEDGRNVAVTYEAKDAEAIVRMQETNEELLKALQDVTASLAMYLFQEGGTDKLRESRALFYANCAIEKAEKK